MLKIVLFTVLAATVQAQLNNSTNCVQYYNPCAGTSNADSVNCCNYPAVVCLPDAQNGTSCLSPLDLVNISPQLTGLQVFQPMFQGLQNNAQAISDLVEINGQTVYNQTEIFTPSSTSVNNG
ncbi:uncharacterized protein LOC106672349 [Cimex lectularius]|uniref:Secreted protein n=1 Tax=Cimex lectularius TaxID=79782 RepID=A0A8I6S831_CIMLE|nr:uncharacterized protein LOC106672349 [Cimex lectularius]